MVVKIHRRHGNLAVEGVGTVRVAGKVPNRRTCVYETFRDVPPRVAECAGHGAEGL